MSPLYRELLPTLRRVARFYLDDARAAKSRLERLVGQHNAATVALVIRRIGGGRRAWEEAVHDVVTELKEIDSGVRAGVFP